MKSETDISERDLILVRLRFLDLLKSFFQEEPDAEKMSRWRGIFAALAMERINPDLDMAIANLDNMLASRELQSLQAEYYTLFIDPYSKDRLPLNGSYYLDGKSYGPSLADYRELLKQAQLINIGETGNPEDSLLLMLDAFVSLIEEEKKGSRQAETMQRELLNQFILPTVEHLMAAVQENRKADFYQHCIFFLQEYLELEQGILELPDNEHG